MADVFKYTRIANFYETDAAKIVHFSNYFKYVEEAEEAFILSLTPGNLSGDIWVRSNVSCEYHMPVRFDEEFTVEISVTSVSRNQIDFKFSIFVGENLSATGNYNAKPVSLSESGENFEKKEFSPDFVRALNGWMV